MLNSKVFRLFLALEAKQHKKIESFLKSFSGNKAEDSQKLFSCFTSPGTKLSSLTKEKAFEYIFPRQAYNDQKLRLVQSELLKMIEAYLVFEIVHDDDNAILSEMILLEFYRKNKLGKLYASQFNKLKKHWDKSNTWDTEKLSQNIKLEIEQYQSDSIERRKEKLNIEEISDSIDLYYFAQKLKFACLASSHQSVYSHNYELQHMDWVLAQVSSCGYDSHPLNWCLLLCVSNDQHARK